MHQSAFLLIADRNDRKSLFNAFQYLIGGGLAMLIFLIGVVQAFTFTGSFLLEDLVKAPETALCGRRVQWRPSLLRA